MTGLGCRSTARWSGCATSTLADAELVDWLNDQKDVGGFNDFGLPYMPTPRDALAAARCATTTTAR